MRLAVLLAPSLAILLLAAGIPLADAGHAPRPPPGELLRGGDPILFYINQTGSSRGDWSDQERSRSSESDQSYSWNGAWTWEITGVLRKNNLTGELATMVTDEYIGTATMQIWADGQLTERAAHRGYLEGELVSRSDRKTDCTLRARGAVREYGIVANYDENADELKLSIGYAGQPLISADWSPCLTVDTGWSKNGGEEAPRSSTPRPHPPINILFEESLRDTGVPGNFVMTTSLAEPKQIVRHSLSGPLLGSEEEHPNVWLCPSPSGGGSDPGSCSGSGEVDLRAIVMPCEATHRSLMEHAKIFAEIGPAPSGPLATEAVVIAYREAISRPLQWFLSDARQLAIMGCPMEAETFPPGLDEALHGIREQLEALEREGKLSARGVHERLSNERARQLMGLEEAPAAAAVAPTGNGALTLQVHSPVSLHAWTHDGRHVGWNATRAAPDVEIEGATYEGAPRGWQRLTLPAGFYRVEVEELAAGTYILESSWNGSNLTGSEQIPGLSKPGETVALHYALAPTGVADEMRLEAYGARRLPTSGAFRFVDEPSASAVATGEGARAATSEGARAPDAAKDAPGLPLAALLAALAIVAWRRRAA